ncbi:unnamed protein product [Rhizoctonia solani]|uniref:Cullin family profile domain-containing protein n=1 Tax=Rhizoctonia solani TaxID=456999 RepID=A0A8H3HUT7_9AGAM|nr:unnamed protein product [Rhizoctonia solani]
MSTVGALAMPPASAGLATIWPFMEEWIEHVMTRKEIQDSYPKYMRLYTTVYNYCTTSRIHDSAELNALGTRTGAITGFGLYDRLAQYFATHVEVLQRKANSLIGQSLLLFYVSEWDRFATGARYVNRAFAFLNRHWVRREQHDGRDVHEVYILALVQWRDRLLYPIQNQGQKLVVVLLNMIERERNGEIIDSSLIRETIHSFVTLGLNHKDQNQAQLDVYQNMFQIPFIEATEEYYARESADFFQTHTSSAPEYVKKAEDRLREEEARVARYLHFSTLKPLISKCEDTLIRGYMDRMQADAQELFYSDKDEDLQRISHLLSRVVGGLDPLKKRFRGDVNKTGLETITDMQAAASRSPGGMVEPELYVDTLHEVYRKYQDILNRSFHSKALAGFSATLDQAFRDFVNRNDAIGTSPMKFPELLARYADTLLRKNNKLSEQDAIETQLNKMALFNHIEDKDIFQTLYTVKLSRRLIYSLSGSNENEAYMISKLKETCGFEYTNKIQRMFTDIELSRDLTTQFREHLAMSHDATDPEATFGVAVLGTNLWPLSAPTHNFTIPKNILPTYERFRLFYQTRHSGRKLIWLWKYSENELQTNYLNQRYMLMTNSYQMAVLVQYNENNALGLDYLLRATGIPTKTMTQILGGLVKFKILVNKEMERYDLNLNFKCKKIRVKLNQPIKAEVKDESPNIFKAVDEDRKYTIQATIVRIMKARQVWLLQ